MNLRQTVARYNSIPNLFWSVVNLLPISVFSFYIWNELLFVFLGIGFITLFFPRSVFSALQLSKTVSFYRKLGVHRIIKFTQNGTIINQLIRQKFPDYRM